MLAILTISSILALFDLRLGNTATSNFDLKEGMMSQQMSNGMFLALFWPKVTLFWSPPLDLGSHMLHGSDEPKLFLVGLLVPQISILDSGALRPHV